MSNFSFRIQEDKVELLKQNTTVTSVAVVTTKFISIMCDCTVDSHDGKGNYSLVLGISRVSIHAHVRSHVSPCMECCSK